MCRFILYIKHQFKNVNYTMWRWFILCFYHGVCMTTTSEDLQKMRHNLERCSITLQSSNLYLYNLILIKHTDPWLIIFLQHITQSIQKKIACDPVFQYRSTDWKKLAMENEFCIPNYSSDRFDEKYACQGDFLYTAFGYKLNADSVERLLSIFENNVELVRDVTAFILNYDRSHGPSLRSFVDWPGGWLNILRKYQVGEVKHPNPEINPKWRNICSKWRNNHENIELLQKKE